MITIMTNVFTSYDYFTFFATFQDKALKSIENLSQKISLSESSRDHALVIDGHSLMHFVHDTPAEQLFLSVVQKCASVVCCRTTPIQKVSVSLSWTLKKV